MNKKALLNLAIIVVVSLAIAGPVLAQAEGPGIGLTPATAVEAVGLLVTAIGSVLGVGSVTNVLVDALKQINWLRFLGPDKQARIAGLWAEIAVIVVTAFTGWAATEYLVPFAHYLDQIGVWPIVGASLPFARWLYWQFKAMRVKNANLSTT